MAKKYVRLKPWLEVSSSADLVPNELGDSMAALTADTLAGVTKTVHPLNIFAQTGGSTVPPASLTTVDYFIVHNEDTSNFVTVVWTDEASNANTQKVKAGKFLVIPGVDDSQTWTITADTADVQCTVYLVGDAT